MNHTRRHRAYVEVSQTAKPGEHIVTFGEFEMIPFGAPNPAKPGDSVTTNVISRVARIKSDEQQVDPSQAVCAVA
jgi:hypothetical protein